MVKEQVLVRPELHFLWGTKYYKTKNAYPKKNSIHFLLVGSRPLSLSLIVFPFHPLVHPYLSTG